MNPHPARTIKTEGQNNTQHAFYHRQTLHTHLINLSLHRSSDNSPNDLNPPNPPNPPAQPHPALSGKGRHYAAALAHSPVLSNTSYSQSLILYVLMLVLGPVYMLINGYLIINPQYSAHNTQYTILDTMYPRPGFQMQDKSAC